MADKKATREAYGEALAEFGAKYDKLVVLDADLAGATKTAIFHGAVVKHSTPTSTRAAKIRIFFLSICSLVLWAVGYSARFLLLDHPVGEGEDLSFMVDDIASSSVDVLHGVGVSAEHAHEVSDENTVLLTVPVQVASAFLLHARSLLNVLEGLHADGVPYPRLLFVHCSKSCIVLFPFVAHHAEERICLPPAWYV